MAARPASTTVGELQTTPRRPAILFGVVRSGLRLAGFAVVLAIAAGDYACASCSGHRAAAPRRRASWLQRWSRIISRLIGLKLDHCGTPPKSGMIVSNHLSYLDILALGALVPCVFVAKKEVASWPLIGWFARMAGTIFVDRGHRMKVADVNLRIAEALQKGTVVVLFPEGTSSDGRTVLPFRSSLLEPVILSGCAAVPAAIRYQLDEGSVSDEVCYWRDMTLLPHLLNLFGKRRVRAQVAFEAGTTYSFRKEAAGRLHARVCALHAALEEASSPREMPVLRPSMEIRGDDGESPPETPAPERQQRVNA